MHQGKNGRFLISQYRRILRMDLMTIEIVGLIANYGGSQVTA